MQHLVFTAKQQKSKAIPVTGHEGLYRFEMLSLPHCPDNRLTNVGEVVSLTHRPRSTPQKHSLF
jgi:hypothetical protein